MASLVFRSFPKIGKWQDAFDRGNDLFANQQRGRVMIDPATGQQVRMQQPLENRLFSAKIKLHGTNAGIQTDGEGNFVTQSRNRLLSTTSKSSDNNGFCAWVHKNLSLGWDQITKHVVLFGEFVGPGIFNDACARLPERMLFIFAVLDVERDIYHFLPDDILGFVQPIIAANPGAAKLLHVLPEITTGSRGVVFTEKFYFGASPDVRADWEAKTNKLMSEIVMPMEKQDPYIMRKFGIDGPGEGIVVFANTWNGLEYQTLMFKMKTPHHTEDNADLGEEKEEDPRQAFARRYVTPARCEKVCAATTEHDVDNSKLFIDALIDDVRQETVWDDNCEAAVRHAAWDWWNKYRKSSARVRRELGNAAENRLAEDLVANNEAMLIQLADIELATTEISVDKLATIAAERLVPDSQQQHQQQLRKKVSKRVKTWWLMRDKRKH